jgi:MFS family permease
VENLGKFSLLYFLYGAGVSGTAQLVPIFLSQNGFSSTEIGLLAGVISIASLPFIFPSGVIADRLSSKKAMALGLLIASPFYLIVSL